MKLLLLIFTFAILHNSHAYATRGGNHFRAVDDYGERRYLNNYIFEGHHHQPIQQPHFVNHFQNSPAVLSHRLVPPTASDLRNNLKYLAAMNSRAPPSESKIVNKTPTNTVQDTLSSPEVTFGLRTIFDGPKNCKQWNFKGKCIKY